jgi:hypothetical protein
MDLIEDKRTDPATRAIFVRAFELVEHCIAPDGTWVSMAHEFQAVQALQREFSDLEGQRLFAVMAYACSVRASGRRPV